MSGLAEGAQDAIDVRVLEEIGPQLGRPHVDTLAGSRHPNLKELRTLFAHHQFRIAFAFDTKRQAILLLGGDKTGANQRRFYKKLFQNTCASNSLVSIAPSALEKPRNNPAIPSASPP
jgi:hypothetical protein